MVLMITFQMFYLTAFLVVAVAIIRYATGGTVTEPSSVCFCAWYDGGKPRFFYAVGWPEAVAEALVSDRMLVGISRVTDSNDVGTLPKRRRQWR
jgi:hypothetical protein